MPSDLNRAILFFVCVAIYTLLVAFLTLYLNKKYRSAKRKKKLAARKEKPSAAPTKASSPPSAPVAEQRKFRNAVGVCPRCGAAVVDSKISFSCSEWRNGCGFKIWKTGKPGSMMQDITLTPRQAETLLNGEIVQMSQLYSAKKDEHFQAYVYLDDSKQLDTGAKIAILPDV